MTKKFPNCGGLIDGSHIPILKPRENEQDYINRKNWASIVLQAVVDARGRFTSCFVGYPGSVHDARVFANSSIAAKMNRPGGLFNGETVDVLGHRLPVCLLGDTAYPLKLNLMKVCCLSIVSYIFLHYLVRNK